MARALVTCPGCDRRVTLVAPRTLAPHRIPAGRLATDAPAQTTLSGEALILRWPYCRLGGIELDAEPALARR